MLNVDVKRSNTVANGMASVTLLSGSTALTNFQLLVNTLTATIDTN